MDLSGVDVDELPSFHMKRFRFKDSIHPERGAKWEITTDGYQKQLKRLRLLILAIDNIHDVIIESHQITIVISEKEEERWEETQASIRKLLTDY